MKVTSFIPIYGTKDVNKALDFFAQLGFERKHHVKTDYVDLNVLENEKDSTIDVMEGTMVPKEGFFAIRVNVSDLNEAIELFKKDGAKEMTPVMRRPSVEFLYMKTSNGDVYCVSHHIKK
jgi:predicted enzyme related to lactoylglutathione lyase